jgi:hypothetical protein
MAGGEGLGAFMEVTGLFHEAAAHLDDANVGDAEMLLGTVTDGACPPGQRSLDGAFGRGRVDPSTH